MTPRTILQALPALFIGSCVLPAVVLAQSSITGVATDASGAVLPGVSVEATSPALIEGARATVTDAEGRYAIVNLRPGTYSVSFTLTGFSAFVRNALALPSDFTATVNAELRVGTLEETVTVSGQAPVVDVESTQRTTVLPRQILDSVPTGRTYAAAGALVVGVRVSEPNVGGTRTGTQQRLVAYGSLAKDVTVDVDGMKSGGVEAGGDDQQDHNDGMTAEVIVRTSGSPAEVAYGGPYMNLIPREGGNLFSGATYFGYTNGAWQSDNLGELRSRGLSNPDSVDMIYYANVSTGGPIVRNKLWFFGSYGNNGNNNIVSNSFYPDGRPGIFDNRVKNYTVRLTWQATQRNKITVFDDYATKFIGHEHTSGTDIATASTIRVPRLKYTAAAKWTSTVSTRVLLEAGYLISINNTNQGWQPGIAQERGTAAWYANAPRVDLNRGTTKVSPLGERARRIGDTRLLSASASYVTGAHTLKTGVQWASGVLSYDTPGRNGDLAQRYRDGIPDSVQVENTPVNSSDRMNADLGIYVQDTWRLTNRLTISPGVRFDYLNASIEARTAEAGRFVPLRQFPDVPDLPNWLTVSPRLGVAYDLTGDARTALKGTINRYQRGFTADIAVQYDPMFLQSDIRNWSDCDYVAGTSRCSGLLMPTNGDDIAQDNEIGPSNNRAFGAAPDRHFDQGSKRPYDMEYTIGVERELLAGVSLAGTWFLRQSYNFQQTINQLVSESDYTPFDVPNPLNPSERVTIYNLNPAKQGLVSLLDTTADSDDARASFQGYELTLKARLPNGGAMLGGWSAGKSTRVACANFSDPNTFRNCDQSEFGMPLRHSFKVSGSYPLPLGVIVGATAHSSAGFLLGSAVIDGSLATNWNVPANLFPGGRTQAVTVRLDQPGTEYLERWNQLDFTVKRAFRVNNVQVEPGVEIFNAFNTNTVLVQNQNFGSSLGQPQRVLQGRLMRLAFQLTF
jgi:hypothetical protein